MAPQNGLAAKFGVGQFDGFRLHLTALTSTDSGSARIHSDLTDVSPGRCNIKLGRLSIQKNPYKSMSPGGETGRRKGLKIPRPCGRAGSSPAPGTTNLISQ